MTTTTKQKRRPRRFYYEGDLHALLSEKLPPKYIRGNRVDLVAVAEAFGVHRMSVSSWFIKDRLPVKKVTKIVELANEGKENAADRGLTEADLLPFILPRK